MQRCQLPHTCNWSCYEAWRTPRSVAGWALESRSTNRQQSKPSKPRPSLPRKKLNSPRSGSRIAMVESNFQPLGRCWWGCMNSTGCNLRRSSEDAGKLVSSSCKKPTSASSNSSSDWSISLILTRSLIGTMMYTVSVNQNRRLVSSSYGFTRSSHPCTTLWTRHVGFGTKRSFHYSDLS